jgi:glyoxylase-like metal-dependent hydrolase (beta-lactamase superfamily II)
MKTDKIIAIHHLNCCTNRPLVGRFFNERVPCRVITHILLLETDHGLVLVDTGIGMDDMKSPKRLGFMHIINRPRLDENETALKQIEKRGFRADDVHHIVMTHLDLDHTGGLPDFPNATIHVLKRELEAAMKPESFRETNRYRKPHWAHSPNWMTYEENYTEQWYGFETIGNLKDLPPEILLVRLPGHTKGHCGVAIHTTNKWLLHAGDSYYFYKQMEQDQKTTPGVSLFERFAHTDYGQAMKTRARVRELALRHKEKIIVICSHDTVEFESLSRTQVK